MPNWLYDHLERWHYLSFLKTRKNLELLSRIRFQSLNPEKITALIELVENDLGFRLYQAIEETKCILSESASSEFCFREPGCAIVDCVQREDFESWIEPELRQISECIDRLLQKCNAAPGDVDAIFMTGGSSFVPAIRQLFESKFPAKVSLHAGQEFTSVVEGLALHAL